MNSDLDRLKEFGAGLAPPTDELPAGLRGRALDATRARPAGRRWPRWSGRLAVRRPALRLIGVAATALVLVAVTIAVLLGEPPGRYTGPIAGPPPSSSSAARTPTQLLQLAAAGVAVVPVLLARPDQFVYLQSVAVYQDIYRDGNWSVVGPPMLVREWRSVDGTRDGLIQRRPLNAPQAGWKSELAPGCHHGVLGGSGRVRCEPSPGYDGGLPTSGDAMYAYLYRPGTDGLPAEYAAQLSGDERAFERAASALDLGQTSPAVQAAVFAALTMVPGVTVSGKVSDVSGRPGVALVHKGPDRVTQLIFDPDTYRYLGMTQTLAEQTYVTNASFIVYHLLTQQAFQQVSIVDKVGMVP